MRKLGIIYGGMSTEHDVSIMSAKSIIENLDKEKYEVYLIYINEQGKWYKKYNTKKRKEPDFRAKMTFAKKIF